TMAANYSDGTWRYDTTVGWTHLSNLTSAGFEVDNAGNVFARYSGAAAGLWRWSASAMSWQKLSNLDTNAFRADTNGDLYASFGASGPWRWSPATGWSLLSTLGTNTFVVADNDAYFGRFDTGSVGTWRWTPSAGWSLLTSNRPDVLRTD